MCALFCRKTAVESRPEFGFLHGLVKDILQPQKSAEIPRKRTKQETGKKRGEAKTDKKRRESDDDDGEISNDDYCPSTSQGSVRVTEKWAISSEKVGKMSWNCCF